MLCSKDFKKELEKVFVKYSDVLEALDRYERTGRAGKLGRKKRFNFTLDDDLMKKFRVHCYKNSSKMSSVIEGMIKKQINS